MFRIVVQDSRRTPTSGKVVVQLGHYDPHSKVIVLDKEKAGFYLEHGAKPSPRVAMLLKNEGVKLPKWVEKHDKKKSAIKNPDKLRRNRKEEPKTEQPVELPKTEEVAEEGKVPEATVTEAEEVKTEESPQS
jgi:small subunit ribosomal protein S16